MSKPFPMRAFVLAAGYGMRMRPLSNDMPKPLMPVWNKPVIQRILEMLRDWGVRDVLINVHHGADEIFRFARSNPVPGLRITASFEPDILGTGGALRRAEWFVRQGPFWLVNSDIVADVNPALIHRTFARRKCLAALWLHPTRGPRTVEMKNGWIRSFRAAKPGASGTHTFCGLHLLDPRILRWLPEEVCFAGIIEAYERAMAAGERIAGVSVPDSLWFDIGSPVQYLEAHRALFPNIGKSFVAAAPTARIAPSARVEDSVLWDGAIVTAGARVHDAIVGRRTRVWGEVTHAALRADLVLNVDEQGALRRLGLDPLRATAVQLERRGSARTFVRCANGRSSIMLVRYDPTRIENTLYATHARFLARLGFRTPRILLNQPRWNRLWMEDAGSTSVQSAWRSMTPDRRRALYERVLRAVAHLHDRGAAEAQRVALQLMPPFDASLYRRERSYFAEHFLCGHMRCNSAVVQAARRDLARVARQLLREPLVLVHRDLQSSNILIRRGEPIFIDFQGMRMGAAAYDLASLLCDPYVNLSAPDQEYFLDVYNRHARRAIEQRIFWLAAVERLAQALGAYARLGHELGLTTFLQHIPPALAQLERAAERAALPERNQWVTVLRAHAPEPAISAQRTH